MLLFGMWAVYERSRKDQQAMRTAVERDLGALLNSLENGQENGRFPALRCAQASLHDELATNRVYRTSLFSADDLRFNPNQPFVGSEALVLCARVPWGLFAIQADRKARNVTETEIQKAGLVQLANRFGMAGYPAETNPPLMPADTVH